MIQIHSICYEKCYIYSYVQYKCVWFIYLTILINNSSLLRKRGRLTVRQRSWCQEKVGSSERIGDLQGEKQRGKEWKGNEEEISVLVAEEAWGLVALPSPAHTRNEWLVILCLLAFPFSKATTRDTIALQHHTHTSHKALHAHNILNVS